MFIKNGPKTEEEAASNAVDNEALDAASDAANVGQSPSDSTNVSVDQAREPEAASAESYSEPKKKGFTQYLREHTHPSRDKDDLLDVHIGNPLKRITELLEDIKRQKAFSFTLRGSLGIMGVALALSTFGILGGSKMLCDKGTQSYIGIVKQLTYVEEDAYPLLTQISDAYNILVGGRPHEKPTTKLILIQRDSSAINLQIARLLDRGGPVPDWMAPFLNRPAIVTGNYDSCSRTLKIEQQTGVERLK